PPGPARGRARLGVLDRVAQLGEIRLGADEHTVGNPPRFRQFRIYPGLVPDVEAEPGEVLQAQVAIRVDGGALEPAGEIRAAPDIARDQIDRRLEADVAQGRGGARIGVESLRYRVDVDRRRLELAEQHHVGAVLAVVDPDDSLR